MAQVMQSFENPYKWIYYEGLQSITEVLKGARVECFERVLMTAILHFVVAGASGSTPAKLLSAVESSSTISKADSSTATDL